MKTESDPARGTVRSGPQAGGLVGTGPERVVVADNLPWMRSQEDNSCDLIYVDPPFGPSDDDGVAPFVAFLRPRLAQMHRLLSPHGSMYVHLDWRMVHYVKVLMDDLFGRANFLN